MIMIVVMAVVLGGFYWYYQDSQKKIAVLQGNNAKLEVSVQTQRETIEQHLEDAQKASRLCVIYILAQLQKAVNGNLDKVKNCVKITGFVNSTDDFKDQPKVLNSASEILSNVFGDNGKHARAAVSVNSLPLEAAVDIGAIFEI